MINNMPWIIFLLNAISIILILTYFCLTIFLLLRIWSIIWFLSDHNIFRDFIVFSPMAIYIVILFIIIILEDSIIKSWETLLFFINELSLCILTAVIRYYSISLIKALCDDNKDIPSFNSSFVLEVHA